MTVAKSLGLSAVCVTCCLAVIQAHRSPVGAQRSPSVLRSFPIATGELATTGENDFFILKPGYQLTFRHPDARKSESLVITVLNETKNVGGIDARIVEERESKGGELIEVSRNYFAISTKSGDVYYLGEDVDIVQQGQGRGPRRLVASRRRRGHAWHGDACRNRPWGCVTTRSRQRASRWTEARSSASWSG